MSAIFKSRKAPKHLIITDEYTAVRKRRPPLGRALLVVLAVLVLAWVYLQFR